MLFLSFLGGRSGGGDLLLFPSSSAVTTAVTEGCLMGKDGGTKRQKGAGWSVGSGKKWRLLEVWVSVVGLWGKENGFGEEGGLSNVEKGTLEVGTMMVSPKGGRLA
ncbi:hypothetical protein NC653_030970 [Populus alba x Populus x berolinensis]|uniref:Uncharacterized protein n=1 Tax=Populus alba x Populus x berolinensis TaxID=444605 RepID=A0AAD6LYE9_9ROSI|nr:hypothetical protein NC653_030970 [Populus alba x Populus x berolinensis]